MDDHPIFFHEDLLKTQINDLEDMITLAEMAQVRFSSMGETKNDFDYEDYQILCHLSSKIQNKNLAVVI